MQNQLRNIFPNLKVNEPSFLLKIYEILENDSLTELISWNKEGTTFVVFNPSKLPSKVLANYFNHKNYPSFLRFQQSYLDNQIWIIQKRSGISLGKANFVTNGSEEVQKITLIIIFLEVCYSIQEEEIKKSQIQEQKQKRAVKNLIIISERMTA